MKAAVALLLIALCLWGASQFPDNEPAICQSDTGHGLTLSFKATLIVGAIVIFLMGGVKPPASPAHAFLEVGLSALILFGLDALHIITPFGHCIK